MYYRNDSPQNAQEFWQDAVRDLHEIDKGIDSAADSVDIKIASDLKLARN